MVGARSGIICLDPHVFPVPAKGILVSECKFGGNVMIPFGDMVGIGWGVAITCVLKSFLLSYFSVQGVVIRL